MLSKNDAKDKMKTITEERVKAEDFLKADLLTISETTRALFESLPPPCEHFEYALPLSINVARKDLTIDLESFKFQVVLLSAMFETWFISGKKDNVPSALVMGGVESIRDNGDFDNIITVALECL